jgi:hypothetical protein
MFLQRRTVPGLQHKLVDGRQVHAFVHQHVGALGEPRKLRIVVGVAGEDDRAVARLELVSEIVSDRRMRRAERRHLDVIGLQDQPIGVDVFRDQKLAGVWAALVLDPGLDIELVQLPIGLGHLLEANGTECVNRRR